MLVILYYIRHICQYPQSVCFMKEIIIYYERTRRNYDGRAHLQATYMCCRRRIDSKFTFRVFETTLQTLGFRSHTDVFIRTPRPLAHRCAACMCVKTHAVRSSAAAAPCESCAFSPNFVSWVIRARHTRSPCYTIMFST